MAITYEVDHKIFSNMFSLRFSHDREFFKYLSTFAWQCFRTASFIFAAAGQDSEGRVGRTWCRFTFSTITSFFIPSSVGIMQYKQFIGFQGAKIILVIILSTAVVMASTGLSSKFLSKLRKDVKHESTSTDR